MDGTVTITGTTVILVKPKDNTSSTTLNWWLKKDSSSNSLNVSGIPLYATEECIRRVFSKCGTIEGIELYSTGKSKTTHLPVFKQTIGYRQATVRFKKLSGVKNALAMKYDNNYTLYDVTDTVSSVAQVWRADLKESYNINTEALRARCTGYMEKYDKRKAEEESRNRKLADESDEEGWTTVTRNKFSRPPKAVKAHELKRLKKKKQTATLLHFYKNQVNDSKMQRIKELKAKFEEDKKKIQEMRQKRKFKPY